MLSLSKKYASGQPSTGGAVPRAPSLVVDTVRPHGSAYDRKALCSIYLCIVPAKAGMIRVSPICVLKNKIAQSANYL
jgi:hypothetical protein